MDKIEAAIFKTLCYADVFGFPLKKDEIYRFLIAEKKISRPLNKVLQQMKRDRRQIKVNEGFYFLAPMLQGREKKPTPACWRRPQFLKAQEKIVKLRKDREKWSRKKLKTVKRAAQFLKIVPSVKMVAVTGALAMGNCRKEDDIDFLIVAEKERLWTTRFLVTILVEVFSKRRRPGDKDVADKICLNMFLDEEHLAVPLKERDLFSAHEVIQLKPLWDRDKTYQKFLWENRWVRKYLPNTIMKTKQPSNQITKQPTTERKKLFDFNKFLILICNFSFFIFHFSFTENVLKHFQLWYMSKRRTTEVIFDGIIRFHPKDARVWVLKEYRKRLNLILE